jgi:glutamate/tyrosine decarboxylase-like PLP-dependent enzyme
MDELDRLQEYVYEKTMKEGRRTISMTQLDGRKVLRLVAISPSVTVETMKESLVAVRSIAGDFLAQFMNRSS